MEDAVDALKMAISVFLFVIGLSIVFFMFSKAREVSDYVLTRTDNRYYTEYILSGTADDDEMGRSVGIETVIPTLYRYYKEKFSVEIVKSGIADNNAIFDEERERKVYTRGTGYEKLKNNKYFKDGISWLASPNVDTQKRISLYVAGKSGEVNNTELTQYSDGLIDGANRNITFRESFFQKETGATVYAPGDGSKAYVIAGSKKLYLTYTKAE